uniref:F-box domain-containing protein n=1 Tax=Setaria italica TaxID=4555 RepID=K3ZTX7_SETIT
MGLQATEQGSHPPAAAAAAADPDHPPPRQLAAPPSPPAGGDGCPEGSTAAVLPDDILLEILSRLPVKALFRFKCISRAWFGFITERLRKIPPTLQGFLYGPTNKNYGHFFNLLGRSVPPVDPSFAFLTKLPEIERIILMGSCNGLVLFLHSRRSEAHEREDYIVCNPATKEWVLVPGTGTQCDNELNYSVTAGYLIFDPAVSSGFKLVQFMFGTNMTLLQVHTYSSENVSIQTWVFSAIVNGMLHLVARLGSDYQVVIVAVDEEGGKHRIISWPEEERGLLVQLGQSQGLLHCTSGHRDDLGYMTELSISALEDYGTEQWILKDSVSCLQLFGEVNCCIADSTVAFHPDHNLVFFFHLWNRKLVSYDMDSKEVTTLCRLGGWIPITPYFPYFVESSALVKSH